MDYGSIYCRITLCKRKLKLVSAYLYFDNHIIEFHYHDMITACDYCKHKTDITIKAFIFGMEHILYKYTKN